MERRFIKLEIKEAEKKIFEIAREYKLFCERVSLETVYEADFSLKSDDEHDYNLFLAAFKIENACFILFGKNNIADDFKWMCFFWERPVGYKPITARDEIISDIFLYIFQEIIFEDNSKLYLGDFVLQEDMKKLFSECDKMSISNYYDKKIELIKQSKQTN